MRRTLKNEKMIKMLECWVPYNYCYFYSNFFVIKKLTSVNNVHASKFHTGKFCKKKKTYQRLEQGAGKVCMYMQNAKLISVLLKNAGKFLDKKKVK